MKRRTIEALRNLAERPGTEAEGKLAREILERHSATPDPVASFRAYLRTGSMDDLADAVGAHTCKCGTRFPAFTACPNAAKHAAINAEMREKFPRGTRVYYNCWAYRENDPGRVTGYPRDPKDWNWIRVKFDRLKNARAIPAYSELGWHLSTEPVDRETLRKSGLRSGMEKFETLEVTA